MSENKDLILSKMNDILSEIGLFKVLSIDRINHNPHRFMIGPKHVSHASDKHGGMLGEETLKAVPCSHPGCRFSYEEHVSDNIAFLQLKRHGKKDEAEKEIKKLVDTMKENKIDGIVMVETDEEYRIT